ncbi:hypothetical protein ACFV4P_19055 [Kitasatospora sp. NPDC059795]|uniref:hypothetical protein n=1 Tax=Kitasatospora sp. NPDC059795 TaxID=3346949 RepID=UPI00364A6478
MSGAAPLSGSPRTRWRRIAAAACAGLVAVPVLAGCTPAQKRAIAVRVDQGNLVIDPGRCPDEKVADVSISAEVDGRTTTWAAVPRSMASEIDRIDPAELGPDWLATGTRPTTFQAAATYEVEVSVSRDGKLDTGMLKVTGETLLRLEAGQVVRGRGAGRTDVMAAADYRAEVGKRCG